LAAASMFGKWVKKTAISKIFISFHCVGLNTYKLVLLLFKTNNYFTQEINKLVNKRALEIVLRLNFT
jgi:hypothetical protein